VPDAVRTAAINVVGAFFERLCHVDREVLGSAHVDPERYLKNIEALNQRFPIFGKQVLEIGSGFGISLAVMLKQFGADAYGIEPDSEGFGESFAQAQEVLKANNLDIGRLIDAYGEKLPFPDGHFDIVYSNNVLEHTAEPAVVLKEAFRVLRPGGTLFLEVPNYLALYEGHYLIFQPPILWKSLLPAWIRWVYRRDPSFARSLRTEINPPWFRKTFSKVAEIYPLRLDSLGEEQFLRRLSGQFEFQTAAVQGNAGWAIRTLQRFNWKNWVGHTLITLQAHYPLVVIATRL
jgi:SAM-dependent methyltransferase